MAIINSYIFGWEFVTLHLLLNIYDNFDDDLLKDVVAQFLLIRIEQICIKRKISEIRTTIKPRIGRIEIIELNRRMLIIKKTIII
jgi:hypothetical protein